MEAKQINTKTLILSLAATLMVEAATRTAFSAGLSYPLITLGAARVFQMALLAGILSLWGNGLASIGLAQSRLFLGLKKGLIWSAGLGVIVAIAFAVLFLAGIDPRAFLEVQLPQGPPQITLFFLVGGVLGPTAEEILFRGIIYGFFRQWGVAPALVVSTLVFLLSHPMNYGLLVVLVGGLLFALSYEVEKNLLVPITIHCLGNMALFTLSLLS